MRDRGKRTHFEKRPSLAPEGKGRGQALLRADPARQLARLEPQRADLGAVLQADRARAMELTPVSRETLSRLDDYVDLLLKCQRRTNLISRASVDELWTRHVADSLQLLALA